MDAFVTTALVGTAQQPKLEITTGTEVDTLTAQLSVAEIERKLLLSAGAWALYRQAGKVSETLPTIPEPAAPESLPTCTPRMTALLESMFKGEHNELLPELLERMQQTGLRLPHELLTSALDTQNKELRKAIFAVLGERGRWLSQFNPAWKWVANYLPEAEEAQLAQAESIWQEGTPGQRQSILQLVRTSDPAKAREWLATAWQQEKAEARTDLLNTFSIGLSADDEEFLENALDDRAASVRASAASLLALLTNSAFALRMQKRADAMLTYSAKKVAVTVPTRLEKDWLRDGITTKSTPYGVGEYTWLLMQVLSLVPPAHWVQHFGISADKLLAAVGADKDWRDTLANSFAKAASLHQDTEWCIRLWDWHNGKKDVLEDIQSELLTYMPQQEAEQRVRNMFSKSRSPRRKGWAEAIAVLPRPWSREFSEAYLQQLHSYVVELDFKKNNSPYYDSWYQSIATAKLALHPESFSAALAGWSIPEEDSDTRSNWQRASWLEELNKFTKAIRIRQRLIKEIVS